MGKRSTTVVILNDGLRGTVERWQADTGAGAQALVSIQNGPRVWVPANMLTPRGDGAYDLPLSRSQVEPGAVVIPSMAEELSVSKRVVETGTVRLRKVVHSRDEVVQQQQVQRDQISVERVPVNQVVAAPFAPRQEGDTLVVPVFEEVLVVEKRLVLKEEIHVTRKRVSETTAPQTVTLRTEEILVERDPKDPRGPT